MTNTEFKIITKRIGNTIKEFRKITNMSVNELAEKAHVAPGSLRNIESGTNTSLPVLLSISKILDIPVYVLFDTNQEQLSSQIADKAAIEIFARIYSSCSVDKKKLLLKIVESFVDDQETPKYS